MINMKFMNLLQTVGQNIESKISSGQINQGQLLNELRSKRNLPPVEIVVVPMVLAKDGGVISTTRIRNSEINGSGNLN